MKKIGIVFIIVILAIGGVGAYFIMSSNGNGSNTTPSKTALKAEGVSTVVHDHWTENDVNDGRIVYVGLVNARNVYISEEIKNLTVTLTVKGLGESYENYSVELFERTYTDVNLSDISYPKGDGFVILFEEIKEYDQECCTAIWAKVKLPDGRVLKTHEPHHFDLEPTEVGG